MNAMKKSLLYLMCLPKDKEVLVHQVANAISNDTEMEILEHFKYINTDTTFLENALTSSNTEPGIIHILLSIDEVLLNYVLVWKYLKDVVPTRDN